MKISITVSRAELEEMNVSESDLKESVIEQLDEAILPGNRRSISFSGYDVDVTVVG